MEVAILPTNDFVFPLLLILAGVIVFAFCAIKILGESRRRADEWLAQHVREDASTPPRKNGNGWPSR